MRVLSLERIAPLPNSGRDSSLRAVGMKKSFPMLVRVVLAPAVASGILWVTSPNQVTYVQWLSAYILLCIPWGGYCLWRRAERTDVPVFPMIAFMFWLYYAFPLFMGDRDAIGSWAVGETIENDAITLSMIMAVLGIVAFWLGMRSGLGGRWSPRRVPDIPHDPLRWNYLRLLMVLGTVTSLFEVPFDFLGEGFAQAVFVFQSIIPMVSFAILFRHYAKGNANRFDKGLIIAFIALRTIVGLSSGWLGNVVYVMITCAAIYTVEKRKIPGIAVAVLIVYVLFFQVGKGSVREKYWYGEQQGSTAERIFFWTNESINRWGEALGDPSREGLRSILTQSLSRVSLLKETANVLELTPSTVPYQYGRLYSGAVTGLVPRFVWPNKPTANEANMFYQVAYGITSEEDLARGSFGVGFLTESFISFGWPGVIVVMFLIGILLDFFRKTLLEGSSGLLLRGIGVVLLPYFLSIESQFVVYFGGTIQRVLFTILVFLPVIRFKRVRGAIRPKLDALALQRAPGHSGA